jgi:hypothetical protein
VRVVVVSEPLESFLVGHRLDVLGWDAVTGAATSEGGRILSYDATRGSSGQHLVHFDGKQEEWINLTVRREKGKGTGGVG